MMPLIDRSSSSSGQCTPKGDTSILLSCSNVPLASLGFSAARKRNFAPLSKMISTVPSANDAERGVSLKVVMPSCYDKLPMFFGKLSCSSQFLGLEAD